MALHDELADLRAEVGPQAFEDPVAFRGAFDDFIAEGAATTGEVSLLVGAIATGALQRLTEQLTLGADPATVIATQGDLLARDRGTSESHGARWALSVLAYAVGAAPADQVLARPAPGPDSLDVPDRPASVRTDTRIVTEVDTGPTQARPDVGPTAVAPGAAATPTATAPPPAPAAARMVNPLLVGAAVVLAIVAVTALVLLLTGGDDPDDERDAGDGPSSASSGTTAPETGEEVLSQVGVTDAGKTVEIQLVRDGADVSVVLLADQDGTLTEIDRVPAACQYLETSYAPGIEHQGNSQLFWGWSDRDVADGFGEYGEVRVKEEMLIPYGLGEAPCPEDQ